MALINCKECNSQVSNQADNCPNCGVKIKKERLSLGKFLALIILFIFIFRACSKDPSEENPPYQYKSIEENNSGNSSKEEVIKYLTTNESKVKDAVWSSDYTLKVGILDDGTLRDGYAQYVCQVIYDYGFKDKNVTVKIIDIAKLVKTDKWTELGSAQCD